MIPLSVLAWVFTVGQTRDMGVELGTMGMALPLVLLLWLVMMAAMMLLSVAPVAPDLGTSHWARSAGPARVARTVQFIGGYVLVWTAFGLLTYGGMTLTGDLVERDPGIGRWIGAGAFALAGLYQLGPLTSICLWHCCNPMTQLLRYARFRPWARDLRGGVHHGGYCLGCCWALMIVLIPLGVMN